MSSIVKYSGIAVLALCCLMLGCANSHRGAAAQNTITPPPSVPGVFWNTIFVNYDVKPVGQPLVPDTPQQSFYGTRFANATWGSPYTGIQAISATQAPYWTILDEYIALRKKKGYDLLYTFQDVPAWISSAPANQHGRIQSYEPKDLKSKTCPDCAFKNFVTLLMQHVCNVTSQPKAPPNPSTCAIKNFEAWNEFNANIFWSNSYSDLAIMARDSAHIIRAYCGDCKIIGGSTSAGGTGYTPVQGQSAVYSTALEQFLSAWISLNKTSGTSEPLPDAISWHPYASRTAYRDAKGVHPINPVPFPETNVSGNGLGTGKGFNGSPGCTSISGPGLYPVPNVNCTDSILTQAQNIRAMTTNPDNQYGVNGVPIWATEAGYGVNVDLFNGSRHSIDQSLRAAYLARLTILVAWSGIQRLYWYAWDEPCWGTEYGQARRTQYDVHTGKWATTDNNNVCANSLALNGGFNEVPTGITEAGAAWSQVMLWLNGATQPLCNDSKNVWTCTLTRTGGYTAEIVWYAGLTPGGSWPGSTTYNVPSRYTQMRDLYGKVSTPGGSININWLPVILEGRKLAN